MLKRIYVFLTSWRFLLHYCYLKCADNRDVIQDDLLRNLNQFVYQNKKNDSISFYDFCYLLASYRMVRNIFYARVASRHKMLSRIMGLVATPQPLLDISSTAKIGGGLIVQHGYGTIVDPKKMGRNCWVNQGVTIGYTNATDAPVIGDNVTIYAGAKVLGDITIGHNVVIGANAVVVKDVPDNCVVGGVPAKILKML